MRGLTARWIWRSPRRVIGPAELRWNERGRVTYCGPPVSPAGLPAFDVVLPGWVNAHAHLQLPPLARQAREAFPAWIRRVLEARAAAGAEGAQRLACEHLASLWAGGCTAVGEIDSTGTSWEAFGAFPLAGRCYREVLGFDVDANAAAGILDAAGRRATVSVGHGYSPHAPYSTSAALFRAAGATGRPLTIHAAEPEGERELLRDGSGPFRDLLASLGKLPAGWRPPGCGTVEYLESLGCLGPRTSLVHCQHLEAGDRERIAASATSIVVCPGTIRWFDREPPPVPEWLDAGIAVALGTDSRASNEACCMRREIQTAARLWPGLSPRDLFEMGTTGGAAALARPDLGRIRPGGRADFVALTGAWTSAEAALEAWVGDDAGIGEVVAVAGGVVCDPAFDGGSGAPGLP